MGLFGNKKREEKARKQWEKGRISGKPAATRLGRAADDKTLTAVLKTGGKSIRVRGTREEIMEHARTLNAHIHTWF